MMDLSARRNAVVEAQRWLERKPVYLDTETTGTGPQAEVIEIGLVEHDGKPLFSALVRPRGQIEPGAARVHGIQPEQLLDAPLWNEVWLQVESFLIDRYVGVYNSEFDLRLMKQSHQRNWMRWQLPEANFFCIMKLYARFYGDWDPRRRDFRYQSLEQAGRQARIPLPNAHRAVDDALLARALLSYMANWETPRGV